MSQTVDRLKELLFDSEARTIEALEARIRELEQRLDSAGSTIDDLRGRVGTDDKLEASVAGVLVGAVQKAEVARHSDMAGAVAPLIVRTVKNEITNSRDELAEALYPMTGRMVKAYVASALKDLANDINRRLEQNSLMLRLRSLATGKSPAELAMADSQRLELEELYLIRRGTGELLARWPEPEEGTDGARDHVMSGVLAAINEFSSEALDAEGDALRSIDLGERHLYLRTSPVYLLAAKCSGIASQPVEALLDEAFLAAIERLHEIEGAAGSGTQWNRRELLTDLSRGLPQRIAERQAELAQNSAGLSPLRLLAWIVFLPLAAWISWSVYADYRTERASAVASSVLAESAEVKGYPVRIEVERLGRVVTVSGLVPNTDARTVVVARLSGALPASRIVDQLSVLPSGLAEFEPRIAVVREEVRELSPEVARVKEDVQGLSPRLSEVQTDVAKLEPRIESVRGEVEAVRSELVASSLRRSVSRTSRRVLDVRTELGELANAAAKPASRQRLEVAGEQLSGLNRSLDALVLGISPDGTGVADAARTIAEATAVLEATSAGIAEALGLPELAKVEGAPEGGDGSEAGGDPLEAAEGLSASAERLGSVTAAGLQVAAVRRSLPPPAPAVVAARDPTPIELLAQWTASHAVFFSSGATYRDSDKVSTDLDELARLIKATGALVRVVGYTDEKGQQEKNTSLSKERADRVLEALAVRGVERRQLVAVGRLDSVDISPVVGDGSPNRRVEFELGFKGELAE